VRERMGNTLPGVAPSNIYLTKDQTYIVIGANADNVFRRLCEAMGREELANDPKFSTHHARGENMQELDRLIEDWTKQHTADECLRILEEKGVPAGKIYSAKEIVNDPHYHAREMIVNVQHPVLGQFPMPGIVPKLSRTPGSIREPGAEVMGKHNEEVYGNLLGYTKEMLEQLKRENII